MLQETLLIQLCQKRRRVKQRIQEKLW